MYLSLIFFFLLPCSMARTNISTPRDVAALPSQSAGNISGANIYGGGDVRNSSSSNQTPRTNVMNGPKQLPPTTNGTKHNHIENHVNEPKVSVVFSSNVVYNMSNVRVK